MSRLLNFIELRSRYLRGSYTILLTIPTNNYASSPLRFALLFAQRARITPKIVCYHGPLSGDGPEVDPTTRFRAGLVPSIHVNKMRGQTKTPLKRCIYVLKSKTAEFSSFVRVPSSNFKRFCTHLGNVVRRMNCIRIPSLQ
jgi:hypothetical protein